MRKLIKLSIILAVLFLTLFLILFGPNSFNIILLIGLLYLVFLFVLFYKKDKYKTGVTKFLVTVLMVFFNLIFIVFFIILLLNIPKEGSVTNRFKTELPSKYKIANFDERLKTKKIELEHMEKVHLKHLRTEKVMDIVESNYSYSDGILNFIIKKGNDKIEEEDFLNNYKFDQIAQMNKICLIELNNIKKMMNDNQFERAKKRYLRIWKSLNILIEQNYSLHEIMIFSMISKQAVHFAERVNIEKIRSNKIEKQILTFIENLENSYRNSLVEEFYMWKENELEKLPQELSDEGVYNKNNFESIFFSWPFWDRNEFLSLLNYFLYDNYKLTSKKFYKVSNKVMKLQENRNKQDNFPYYLTNPTGKIFVFKHTPKYVDYLNYMKREKSKLKFYSWFVSEKFNDEFKNVPEDNLTGKNYKIENKSNKLIVTSKHDFSGFYSKYKLELRVSNK
ncbi:MAG TPA: hypothetical protein VKN74_03150 [Candidatus Mcinerneyibacterium sp.]|nr:hypothetical protein [Candidatus Mcinerneyibacterium sp.]